MPTGYTSDISKGISFKQYALSCARAFGACIEMRDDPADKPIPSEFKPSGYHKQQFNSANKRLKKLKAMSVEDCVKKAKAEHQKSVKYHQDAIKKDADLKSKYEAMLAEVDAYTPPSQDHVEFKKFMHDQIVSSIEFDCMGDYHQNAIKELRLLPGSKWRIAEIAKCRKDIAYHTKEQEKENKRAAGRTQWVQQLRKSINQ